MSYYRSFSNASIEEIKLEEDLSKLGELKSEESEPSSSSVPSEHEEGMASNEYWRRYCLKVITITWSRDSHGLFDFETR